MSPNSIKTQCVYCKKEIPQYTIRCDTCNEAWVDGCEHGRSAVKQDLQDKLKTLFAFLNLK